MWVLKKPGATTSNVSIGAKPELALMAPPPKPLLKSVLKEN